MRFKGFVITLTELQEYAREFVPSLRIPSAGACTDLQRLAVTALSGRRIAQQAIDISEVRPAEVKIRENSD